MDFKDFAQLTVPFIAIIMRTSTFFTQYIIEQMLNKSRAIDIIIMDYIDKILFINNENIESNDVLTTDRNNKQKTISNSINSELKQDIFDIIIIIINRLTLISASIISIIYILINAFFIIMPKKFGSDIIIVIILFALFAANGLLLANGLRADFIKIIEYEDKGGTLIKSKESYQINAYVTMGAICDIILCIMAIYIIK